MSASACAAPARARPCCSSTAPTAIRNGCRFSTRSPSTTRCIVPEHPGFGASDDPPLIRSVSDMAMFYLDFLEALELRDLHIVGHSLGGWIAAEILIRDRSRAKSLTLISSAGIRVEGVPSGDLFIWNREELLRNVFYNQAYADIALSLQPTEQQLDTMLKNRFTATKLGWQPRWFNPDLEKWLHRIKLPSLIIWGDEDKVMPAALRRAMARAAARCAARHDREMRTCAADRKTERDDRPLARFPRGGVAMKLISFHLMPYRPLDFDEAAKHRSAWVVLPNSLYDPVKGAEEYAQLHRLPGRWRAPGLRRHRRQRASPERLWADAGAQSHRQRAHPAHQEDQDRDPRPRVAAARQSDEHRRRIRDARQSLARPHHLRLRARHRRRISLDRRQSLFLA